MKSRPAFKASLLETLGKYERGEPLTSADVERTLKLCTHPREEVREAALTLLLQPPVADELGYLRWLISQLLGKTPRVARLPFPLVELVCEIRGFLEEVPGDRSICRTVERLLQGIHPSALQALFDRPIPLHPILPHLRARSFARAFRAPGCTFLRRWRLFRNRLLSGPPRPDWASLNFSDLRPLWRREYPSARRCNPSGGRWRTVGRFLFLKPVSSSALEPEETVSPSAAPCAWWSGAGSLTLHHLESIVEYQAEELRAVRKLAREISRTARRVVFSWHNATLAAAGGWAFEWLESQFPDHAVWDSFLEAVRNRVHHLRLGDCGGAPGEIEELRRLRERRLACPKMLHALRESRMRAELSPGLRSQWVRDLETARRSLGKDCPAQIAMDARFTWHGALGSHQRLRVEETAAWIERCRSLWHEGLLRLAAIAIEGQRFLDHGVLPCLVLPWIDKFFISSMREGDIEYLPRLVKWLESLLVDPLVLFWEDTSHLETPSFQLALERLRREGSAFRGIGIFDRQGSRRGEAEGIILREHRRCRLFALRPYEDTHSPVSFRRLLQSPHACFDSGYDSSWKDNLCFPYVGTQVFALLSIQDEAEPFAAWAAVGHEIHPFGSYFRNRLRYKILGRSDGESLPGNFSLDYALWANLC